MMERRLSVIIPVRNSAGGLGACLDALEPGRERGPIAEIIVVDGGSRDGSRDLAQRRGARVFSTPAGRGRQLAEGGAAASGEWLMFLHGDTVLEAGWRDEVAAFLAEPQNGEKAAVFRFALDDETAAARRFEAAVAARCRVFALPYGDQGLLISRGFYESLGGFETLPIMEDVDMVRRIGRARLKFLSTRAVTSAVRYRRRGYLRRSARNLSCLALYFLGVRSEVLVRLYG